MKENENIDKLFREGVEQHFPVDEGLWTAIEGQLPSTPKQGGLWLFNLNTIALIVVLFVCAMIPTDTVKTSNIITETTNSVASNQVKQNTKITLAKASELTKENSFQPSLKQNDKVTNGESPQPSNTNKLKNNNVLENNQDVTGLKPKSKQALPKERLQPIVETELLPLKENTINSTKDKRKASTSEKESTLASTSVPSKSIQQSGSSSFSGQMKQTKLESSYLGNNPYYNELPSNLNFTLLDPLGFYEMNKELNFSLSPLTVENKKKNVKKSFYYGELEFSQSINISKKLSGENTDLIQYKEENEKSNEQSSYGLNLVKQYKFITYGLGLHYSKYSERVNYLLPQEALGYDVTFDTTYKLVNSNFNSNGTPVFLIEEQVNETQTPTTIIVDESLITTNSFKRIKVPIFIGVQKVVKNWVGEVRTALVANYLIETQGVYINNTTDGIINLNDADQTNSFVLGNKNDLSLGYALNEFFVLGGRFSYEQDLTSFTKPYDSKIRSQSVGLWLLWKPK